MNETYYPRLRETLHRTTLPGGLRVRTVYKPDFAKFYAILLVNCGSVDRRYARDGQLVQMPQGVAHYLEHKLFDMPEGSADALFAAIGASGNAYTAHDFTGYYVQSSEQQAEALRVLLRMAFTPYFTEETVQKERGIIAQEIKMAADDPYDCLGEIHMQSMFPGHPLSEPILGTEESIAGITPDCLRRWYSDFYRPENMVLCVEGNLPPAEVAAIASELLPPAQEGRVESLFDRTPAAPPRTGAQYLRREVSMPTFRLSFPLPDRPPEDQRFEFAAELALELLAGDSADCFRQLYESGLVDSGFTWSIERYRRKAFLSFGGDSRDPEAVCAALCAAARTMLSGGVRSDDLARLKRSMLGRLLRDLDSFSVCCTRLAECTLCGQDYFRFPEILDAITEAELAPLLRAIVPEQAVLTILAPKEEAL